MQVGREVRLDLILDQIERDPPTDIASTLQCRCSGRPMPRGGSAVCGARFANRRSRPSLGPDALPRAGAPFG